MKEYGMLLGIVIISVTAGAALAAYTIGQKPPVGFINNLPLCKASNFKTNTNGYLSQYTINGRQADGRCKVTITGYLDYSNPQTYKDVISVMKMFTEGMSKEKIKESDIPTQAEMIKQAQEEKDVTVCKFTKTQINSLVQAYKQNDWNQNSGSVKRDKNGNITEFSGSFSSSKMSTYDKLMFSFQSDTCTSN